MKKPDRYKGELPEVVLVWRIRQLEDRLAALDAEALRHWSKLNIRRRYQGRISLVKKVA